jgi:NADH-quinone oxidoreductase subunit E
MLGNLAEQLKAEILASPPVVEAPPMEPASVEPAPAEPQPSTEPAPVAVAAQPEPQPPAEPAHVVFAEGAAMRAVEGGWSRRDARALPDAPELTDVSAAVSAAQLAVEQVLTLNGLDLNEAEARAQASFGKPRGLGKPRDGGRDDLKQINGLGPLDESTLNNLGIFHLDQIANWDEREVLWLENHAFARGRIGRETWQAQARDLLAGAGDAARATR